MYIGRNLDSISNVEKLDNITFDGSTSYALTKNSTAFVPNSAQCILISINGIVQQGNFSVNSSNIVFDSAVSSSDVCNWILHYGTGLITTVADGTITNAKLGADSVNGSKIADDSISDEHLDITAITGQTEKTSLADADKFLISDSAASGALKYVQKSNLGGGSFVKLSSGSASSAVNHDFTGFINTSSYDNYWIFLNNILGQAGNTIDFQFADSSGAVSTSNYYYSGIGWRSSDTALNLNGEATSEMQLVAPSSGQTNHPTHCQFYMTANPNGNREGITVQGMSWGYRDDVSDAFICNIMGWYNQPTTITGFRLHASGNDATTFDYAIYGIAK